MDSIAESEYLSWISLKTPHPQASILDLLAMLWGILLTYKFVRLQSNKVMTRDFVCNICTFFLLLCFNSLFIFYHLSPFLPTQNLFNIFQVVPMLSLNSKMQYDLRFMIKKCPAPAFSWLEWWIVDYVPYTTILEDRDPSDQTFKNSQYPNSFMN